MGAIAGLSACSEAEGGRGSGGWTSAASSQSAGDGIGDGIVDPTESGDGGDGFDDDGDGGDGGNVKFDFPDNGGAGDESSEEDGCQKVDFVFVIDSSPSMEDEQSNLLASFPGFVAAIEDQLQINDFHVMVVDAGELGGGACDGTLGAGQIRSGGGQDCGLVGGQRYATQAQPDLPAAFACMANRGDSGPTNERTMDSLLQAVGLQNLVGNCNDGFLRDDAILVVTVITDEEDSGADGMPGIPPLDGSCVAVDEDPNSAGDPAAWKSTLLTAKDGNEDAIVVLGLLGDCDVGGCPGMALDPFGGAALTGAEPAPRLRAFVESFAFGTVGPVCAPDYAPFFASSVNVIESACSDFVPPA
ncbi:MAG: hypothetical protein AAF721_13360 [Myxococcota bacterium]